MTERPERKEEYQVLRSYLKLAANREAQSTAELVSCVIREELTERQREYVEMYYLRQIPMHIIAEREGVNVSTVSRTLARARRNLRRCLQYSGRNLGFLLED